MHKRGPAASGALARLARGGSSHRAKRHGLTDGIASAKMLNSGIIPLFPAS
jgi:hypothetical protein